MFSGSSCSRAVSSTTSYRKPQEVLKEQNDKERMLQLRYENLLVEKENLKGAFLNQVTTEGTMETA